MCKKKSRDSNVLGASDIEMSEVSTSDSDDQITDSSDSDSGESVDMETSSNVDEGIENENEDEEEDETIKNIRNELKKERDHPPNISCEDFITDLSFHPENDILAVADVVGDVHLYRYSNTENELVRNLELHTKSCRDIEFSQDGKILFSTSKDKTIMLSDVETGTLMRFYDDAHDCPIYSLNVIDENVFATG